MTTSANSKPKMETPVPGLDAGARVLLKGRGNTYINNLMGNVSSYWPNQWNPPDDLLSLYTPDAHSPYPKERKIRQKMYPPTDSTLGTLRSPSHHSAPLRQ